MKRSADGHAAAAGGGAGYFFSNKRVRPIIASLALLGAVCLGGCAQVNVISDQGPPKSEWKFGVLAIDLAGSNKNTIVSTSGVGVISTPSGTTVGYSDARIVRIGDECRVVISTKDLAAIKEDKKLLQLLKSTYKACVA
jgi:hypothetical protein